MDTFCRTNCIKMCANISHFHSDHYGGMTANWCHGPIYCSSITGSLVLQQIKVNPEYVVKLPMHQTINVEGVDVTLIEANQYGTYSKDAKTSCPGSVLFLFEKKLGKRTFRILHCGDFRASPVHVNHPAIRGKYLDAVYLDTTYLKYSILHHTLIVAPSMHSHFKRMSSLLVRKNVR